VLSAGQTKTFTFNMTAGSAGSQTFRAFVDSYCQTAETSDANNQGTLVYTVSAPPQPVDFIVQSISLSPSSPIAGQPFTAYVTVKNQGSGSGDGRWLDVWLNQPSAPACGTDGNTWASVGTLTAGQTKTFTFNLTAPATAGSYTFRAFVDSYCQTTESNEGNNQSTLAYTVGSVSLPDFVVTGISFNPSVPIGGQPFTATVMVKNQGTGPGDGRWLDVWAHQPTAQSCGAMGDQYQPVGVLTPGQSKAFTFNLTAPPSGAPWSFRAFVDSGCQTAETNEGNNQSTASYGQNPTLPPDLVITSISISPSDVRPGDSFTAIVNVRNQGTGSGDGGWLDVWKNKPAAAVCDDSGDEYQSVGLMSPGATKTFSFSLTAGPAGLQTLRAFVDSGCQTTESNEANNQLTREYWPAVDVLTMSVACDTGVAPTAAQWNSLSNHIRRASNMLCDATDGQFRFGNITFHNAGAQTPIAEVVVHLTTEADAKAGWGSRVRLGISDEWYHNYGTIVHELGHYLWNLGDEYTSTAGVQPSQDPSVRRYCGFTTGRTRSIMELQYFEDNTWALGRGSSEFCTADGPNSQHRPINANGETAANVQDSRHNGEACWETIRRLNVSVVMPASGQDPLPGPCSRSSDPNSALSHEPLGSNEGVGGPNYFTITGP
jgi:hypothetical protein